MTEITKVPGVSERVETGPLQFGDDWPGVFIRGDNALADALMIDHVLALLPTEDNGPAGGITTEAGWQPPIHIVRAVLTGLRDTLRSCSVGDTGWPPSAPTD